MSFIVNKSGTVHSIPHEWLAELLASGARKASQDEIDAYYASQGLKDVPKVADVDRAYAAYERSLDEIALAQSTTIGPAPGSVDVRMAQPGDPGFVVGTDGMRQVPSRITPESLNTSGAASYSNQGFGEQIGHTYEAVVPEVAQASVVSSVPVEQAAMEHAASESTPVSYGPTAVGGPPPAGSENAPGVVANADATADAGSGPKGPAKSDK